MNKEEILEVMKIVREAEDSLREIRKSLYPFSDDDNWNSRYTDDKGKIEKFNFLELDPRIIAQKGLTEIKKADERLASYWYDLRERLFKLEKGE